MTSRGLLILALLLVFILILLVIIVVLAALWPRNRAQEAPKVCDTPACLRAAAQVLCLLSLFLFFFDCIGFDFLLLPRLHPTNTSWKWTSYFSQLQWISNFLCESDAPNDFEYLVSIGFLWFKLGSLGQLDLFYADMVWRIHKSYLTQYLTFLHDSKAQEGSF